jgi:hypothetical protein
VTNLRNRLGSEGSHALVYQVLAVELTQWRLQNVTMRLAFIQYFMVHVGRHVDGANDFVRHVAVAVSEVLVLGDQTHTKACMSLTVIDPIPRTLVFSGQGLADSFYSVAGVATRT